MLSIGVFSPENLRKYMNFPFYFTTILEIWKKYKFLSWIFYLQEETSDFAEEPFIIKDPYPSAHIPHQDAYTSPSWLTGPPY